MTRRLSKRETEVLALLAEGLTGNAIAERLVLSPDTVRTHVRNAMDKLEARTRLHAVVLAIRAGDIAASPGPLEHGRTVTLGELVSSDCA